MANGVEHSIRARTAVAKGATPTAVDVAAYILDLAASEEEPELVSHLRLQKILYYAQGWSLGMRGRELFGDPIEAWTDGPVVRSVYKVAWTSKHSPVAPSSLRRARELGADDQQFVASVWQAYRQFSAVSLRDMTHQEEPWLKAREGLVGPVPSDRIIEVDVMRDYFQKRAATS